MTHPTLMQTFGEDKRTGRMAHVSDVPTGRPCGCRCPYHACGKDLIAKNRNTGPLGPRQKQPHFAHVGGAECPHGAESALHKAAKQLMVDDPLIKLPPLSLPNQDKLDEPTLKALGIPARPARLLNVRPEVGQSVTIDGEKRRFTPDLVATEQDGSEIFIEIFVSHATTPTKIEYLKPKGVKAVEIDLSQMQRHTVNFEELSHEIQKSVENKQWLCHPGQDALQNAIDTAMALLASAIPVKLRAPQFIPVYHTPGRSAVPSAEAEQPANAAHGSHLISTETFMAGDSRITLESFADHYIISCHESPGREALHNRLLSVGAEKTSESSWLINKTESLSTPELMIAIGLRRDAARPPIPFIGDRRLK